MYLDANVFTASLDWGWLESAPHDNKLSMFLLSRHNILQKRSGKITSKSWK